MADLIILRLQNRKPLILTAPDGCYDMPNDAVIASEQRRRRTACRPECLRVSGSMLSVRSRNHW
jgi:hypothetical protein